MVGRSFLRLTFLSHTHHNIMSNHTRSLLWRQAHDLSLCMHRDLYHYDFVSDIVDQKKEGTALAQLASDTMQVQKDL